MFGFSMLYIVATTKLLYVLRTPEKREDKNKINNFQYITLNNNLVHIEKSTHKH